MKYFLPVLMLIAAIGRLAGQTTGEQVYIHTDRDIYGPLDEMKFKAYVKPGYSSGAVSSRLFVYLLNPAGKPVVEENFAVSDNQAAGSVIMPDSLPEGEYRMLGYTSRMENGSTQDVFSRKVLVRNPKLRGLFVSLKLDEPFYEPGENVELSVHISLPDRKPCNSEQFLYLASKNGVPYQNGIGKTDEDGNSSFLVRIPYTPDEGLIIIEVTAEYKKFTGTASILVPATGMPFSLKFFPEGGSLIDGLDTKVGFRAQDYQGNPLEFAGVVIDRDNKPVDSIRSNKMGLGSFNLIPHKTDSLKVRITRPSGFTREVPLPGLQADGVQLIYRGKSGGSLDFLVRTNVPHANQQLMAVAESGGRILARIPVAPDDSLMFRVPVGDPDGGIVRVSLLTGEEKILAGRSVFIAPPLTRLESTLVKGKGGSGSISVTVKDAAGFPVPANLSVSVTDGIMNPGWNREPDIVSWFLLGPMASALPYGYFSNPAGIDLQMIDNLMLTQTDATTGRKQVKSGMEPQGDMRAGDFRNRVMKQYTPGLFEQLVAQYHKDLYLNEYFSVENIEFYSFIKGNDAQLAELGMIPSKPTQSDRVRQQLDNGTPILSILRTISPYTLSNNMIVFGKGNNSMNFPKGALFIIDGSPKGYNADILNSYSTFDIANIRVTQKISDILVFSADAGALIYIDTKQAQGAGVAKEVNPAVRYNPTLLWNPEMKITGSGPVSLRLPKPELKSPRKILIQGVDNKGNYVESVMKLE